MPLLLALCWHFTQTGYDYMLRSRLVTRHDVPCTTNMCDMTQRGALADHHDG